MNVVRKSLYLFLGGKMGKRKRKTKTFPRNTNSTIKKEIVITKERGLLVHINNGIVNLCDKYGVPYPQLDIDMEKTYTGVNKTRVVTKATELKTGSNTVGEWVKNFDVVYAVDTNTKTIHEGRHNFSIGVVFKGTINQTSENGGEIQCELFAGFAWYWCGEHKIEPKTWVQAIKKIQEIESADTRIGLVIDSELGDYEAYNSRVKPLDDGFMLPSNITLIYASADYSDEWTNKMIKLCDKTASENIERCIADVEKIDESEITENCSLLQIMQVQ